MSRALAPSLQEFTKVGNEITLMLEFIEHASTGNAATSGEGTGASPVRSLNALARVIL